MSETNHTPTPWSTMPPTDTCMVHRIFGGTRYIGLVGNSDNHDQADAANAANIVRCVNAHDALVDTLERILRCDEDCQQAYLAAGALSKLKEETP